MTQAKESVSAKLAYRIWDEASKHSGFIIAFQTDTHPGTIGFSFLASSNSGQLMALHAIARCRRKPLEYALLRHNVHRDEGVRFIDEYIKDAAATSGIADYRLVKAIGERTFLWRYYGFFNGALCLDKDDNAYFWRALWGRIVESADMEHMPETDAPHDDVAMMLEKLRNCAEEGQIILRR